MSEKFIGYADEFDEGARKIVPFNDEKVVVLRHNGSLHAFANRCVHMGGPVGEGIIMPKVEARLSEDKKLLGERFSDSEFHLVCPWHGWEYDLETGECAADRRVGLKKFNVVERSQELYLSED